LKFIALLLSVGLTADCAYFNTFYNATTYFEKGVKALEMGGGYKSTNIPKPASDAFGKAIEKSIKVIEKYPKSRYVDDAFFIIGRSHFYRQEYGLAERYLRQLLQEYPWSPFNNEVRIWLAKVHAQLGLPEAVDEDLAPILEMANPPRALLTEISMLRGDMALRQGDVSAAILNLKEGAELATDATQQAAIYQHLFQLAEEQKDYATALGFLDRFARATPSESERINARLVRVQLLQKLGDLEGAYKEIRNMVALSEFASIIPGLQLELGKIEYNRGNRDEALNRFVEVMDEYGTLPEASEAAYRVGEINFTELHDIEQAQDHFKRVKRNTTYYQMAQVRLGQITTLKELSAQINTIRNQLGLEVDIEDEAESEEELIPDIAQEETPGHADRQIDTTKAEAAVVDTAEIRQNLAYALYRLAETQLFEMADDANALAVMADIVSNFDETEVAAKAAYVLYIHTHDNPDQAAFWRALILEKYPASVYGQLLSDKGSTAAGDPGLDSLRALANEAIARNPQRALTLFRGIRNQFSTEQSSFAIAYLYDEYLGKLDSAIIAYDEYLALYPTGTYSEIANERLDFMRRIKAGLNARDEPEPSTEMQAGQTEVVTPTEEEEAPGSQEPPGP